MQKYKEDLRKREEEAKAKVAKETRDQKKREVVRDLGDEEVFVEEGEMGGQEEGGTEGVATERDEYYKIDVQDDEGVETFKDIEESDPVATPGQNKRPGDDDDDGQDDDDGKQL